VVVMTENGLFLNDSSKALKGRKREEGVEGRGYRQPTEMADHDAQKTTQRSIVLPFSRHLG